MADAAPSKAGAFRRIDAHHHFWRYSSAEYGWIDGTMQPLQRDFLPADLVPLAKSAGIDGVVSVQARQCLEETQWLLQFAATAPLVRGVVGWAPIAAPGFAASLDALLPNPALKGLRHVLQAEPDGYMLGDAFNQGFSLLAPAGLVYDILIVERQLAEAIAFVDLHPNQIFVLDHIAKPLIASGAVKPWRSHIHELAQREHVYCKLSGLVTEADWEKWTPGSLQPYVDTVLDAFGPSRLMAGSDWPVCTLATEYSQWFETLRGLLKGLSLEENSRIFGTTASEVYRL